MGKAGLKSRSAQPRDVAAMTAIYNEGIADRIAIFETDYALNHKCDMRRFSRMQTRCSLISC